MGATTWEGSCSAVMLAEEGEAPPHRPTPAQLGGTWVVRDGAGVVQEEGGEAASSSTRPATPPARPALRWEELHASTVPHPPHSLGPRGLRTSCGLWVGERPQCRSTATAGPACMVAPLAARGRPAQVAPGGCAGGLVRWVAGCEGAEAAPHSPCGVVAMMR